ncbi:MAG: dihydroneopterin aldolase [Candidatus Howiella sp.]|jgi:dihydroneopterin aldolase
MNRIVIKGLEVFAYHGVNEEEKQNGQRFVLDVTLWADLSAAERSDRLEDTVNYAAVRKTLSRVMTDESCNLIEHAAARAGDAVLSEFPKVERVEILLKKPDAPMSAKFDYVAVEVVRER